MVFGLETPLDLLPHVVLLLDTTSQSTSASVYLADGSHIRKCSAIIEHHEHTQIKRGPGVIKLIIIIMKFT
jgi:hypothetical protein